jgi:hypothetical protein
VNTKAAEKMFDKIKEWMGDCSNVTLIGKETLVFLDW